MVIPWAGRYDRKGPRYGVASLHMTPGIEFDGVWKKFRRGERHDSLRDLIPAAARRLTRRGPDPADLASHEFWAVRDVSFRVEPGEAVGIIGPNGAGKSTTLKLLTRLLKPTRGICRVRGRVGALIEVAAGFHPDLTGRENIFLQGAIMGMKRHEINARFDRIVDFAGVADFLDTQVKRYSSGMNARLGFAIAAHLDPDVMIIDEVLSVGDSGYQAKCVAHMRGMIENGTPVVFVSHNLPAVLELCTRVLVVSAGTVQFNGNPAEGVQGYRRATFAAEPTAAYAKSPIRITKVEMLDDGAQSLGVFRTGADVVLKIAFHANEPIADPNFRVEFHNANGVLCFGTTTYGRVSLGTVTGHHSVELALADMALLPGCYMFSVAILKPSSNDFYDLHQKAYPFSIESNVRDTGIVSLEHSWRAGPRPD
jgi:lipopolysaccharide transport system ATP-binding protein